MQKKFMKKKELIILAVIALFAIVGAVLIAAFSVPGKVAVVYYNGEEVTRIDLRRDHEYHIDANLPVTLEVKGGEIRFVSSHCPDKLCEGFGFIGDEYEYAICIPAGVTVMIEGE